MMTCIVIHPYDATCNPVHLADDLGLDVADVAVVLRWPDMAPVDGRLTVERAVEVAALLDPHHERRAPELYGQAAVETYRRCRMVLGRPPADRSPATGRPVPMKRGSRRVGEVRDPCA